MASSCGVVWLDGVRYFLEDMEKLQPLQLPGHSGRKPLYNYASCIEWLLSVAIAKQEGGLGGFETITTGEENPSRSPIVDEVLAANPWSSPVLGYMQPAPMAIFPDASMVSKMAVLEKLRFHCGGAIFLFTCQAPPALQAWKLDGSCGWSKSCKHMPAADEMSVVCACPRTPVSPWGAWSHRIAWQAFNAKLPCSWQRFGIHSNRSGLDDNSPVAVHHVTVVVFRRDLASGKFKVLKIFRDPDTGGHFAGMSAPGGNVAFGKDRSLWAAAEREWNEEVGGYPWSEVVAHAPCIEEERMEEVAGQFVYRKGPWLLCAANIGDIWVTDCRSGLGQMTKVGQSPRSMATIYAEASRAFCDGWPDVDSSRQISMPEHAVMPKPRSNKSVGKGGGKRGGPAAGYGKATAGNASSHVSHDIRKVHTHGWTYLEHAGVLKWVDWDEVGDDDAGGANIFPSKDSDKQVLRVLEAVYDWR